MGKVKNGLKKKKIGRIRLVGGGTVPSLGDNRDS